LKLLVELVQNGKCDFEEAPATLLFPHRAAPPSYKHHPIANPTGLNSCNFTSNNQLLLKSFGQTIVTLDFNHILAGPLVPPPFTMPQRRLKYFEPGILFTILGLFHAALLFSFAHGTITTTVTVQTLAYTPPATPPSQSISFPDPTNPDATVIFECPAKCNGGAACEWVNPTNCSEYINCDYRREPVLLACEEGLYFWDQLKQCAPPSQAKCNLNKAKRVGNQDL
jgi:hypothetical protein